MTKKQLLLHNAIKLTNDWPVKGVIFKDLIPIMNDPKLLRLCIHELAKKTKKFKYDTLVSAESRGFWFSIPLALKEKKYWVPCRKPGKLPGKTVSQSFDLEYGKSTLEVQEGTMRIGSKVLILDDLIATGGTIGAMIKLAQKCGAEVVGVASIVNLNFLKGVEEIKKTYNLPVISLLDYDHE